MLYSLIAALTMYTRLPMWRLVQLDQDDYSSSIQWWPMVGFITGGTMALVVYALEGLLPQVVIVVLALICRLLLTGSFHEDGLGDFLDGFGGGRSRERVLEIMKDSHVGSYAVVGYVIYYLLLVSILSYIPYHILPRLMIIADVCGRICSLQQVHFLPYARTQTTSKTGVVYQGKISICTLATLVAIGWLMVVSNLIVLSIFLIVPIGLSLWYVRRRIGGYTGDTLGAIYLLSELSIYLLVLAMLYQGYISTLLS